MSHRRIICWKYAWTISRAFFLDISSNMIIMSRDMMYVVGYEIMVAMVGVVVCTTVRLLCFVC